MITGKRFSACGGLPSRKGFLLIDLMLAIFISAILALLLSQCVQLFVGNWQKVKTETELQNAATYILNHLDKNISQDAVNVAIVKDSSDTDVLNCQTYLSYRRIEIVVEKEMLYLKTTTLKGSGKNPLFPVDCKIKNWQVRLIDAKSIFISFTLDKNGHKRDYTQLLTIINGNAHDERH